MLFRERSQFPLLGRLHSRKDDLDHSVHIVDLLIDRYNQPMGLSYGDAGVELEIGLEIAFVDVKHSSNLRKF